MSNIFNSGKKLKTTTTAITTNELTATLATTSNTSDANFINVTGDRMNGVLIID